MRTFLRFLASLSLVAWVGGIIFFSAVVAPNVFGVLMPFPSGQHLAGDIVNKSLSWLHGIGIVCGSVFLTAFYALRKRFGVAANYFVLGMLLLTCVSQFLVIPRMEDIRSGRWMVDKRAVGGPSGFEQLHAISVDIEGVVLLCGISTLWLVAKDIESR